MEVDIKTKPVEPDSLLFKILMEIGVNPQEIETWTGMYGTAIRYIDKHRRSKKKIKDHPVSKIQNKSLKNFALFLYRLRKRGVNLKDYHFDRPLLIKIIQSYGGYSETQAYDIAHFLFVLDLFF